MVRPPPKVGLLLLKIINLSLSMFIFYTGFLDSLPYFYGNKLLTKGGREGGGVVEGYTPTLERFVSTIVNNSFYLSKGQTCSDSNMTVSFVDVYKNRS